MIKLLFATLLVTVSAVVPVSAQSEFAGTWKIAPSKTVEGVSYTGSVDIKPNGTLYAVQWHTSAGDYGGVGLAADNRLCVGWGGKGSGAVLYHLDDAGNLIGRWSVPGATDEGTEKGVGGTPGDFGGDYAISGTNPGGKGRYEGKLSIVKTGDTYQLKWAIPGTPSYSGIGIKAGGELYVGWSTDGAEYGVAAYRFAKDAAEGGWSVSGAKVMARENLTR